MGRTKFLSAFGLAFSLVAFLPVGAESQEPGEIVLVIRDAPLNVGREQVATLQQGKIVEVKVRNGRWLWVSGDVAGWIDRKNVVPYQVAVDRYTRDINLNPRSANAYERRAALRHEAGEHQRAVEDYARAIELDPRNAKLYNNRGLVYAAIGNHDAAIEDFNRAVELDPQSATTLNNRSSVFFRMDEFDQAIDDLTTAIEIDPEFALAYHNRGYALNQQKKYEQAIQDLTDALRLNPRYASALKLRGDAHRKLGEYAEAKADYAQALQFDPRDPLTRNSMVWLLATCPDEEIRDGKRAVELAKVACEMTDFKNGICIDTLAAAHAEAGDFDRAVELQHQAIALDTPGHDKEMAEKCLELYEDGEPYRVEN